MKLPSLPPYLEGRAAVVLLNTPFLAGAVCAVMAKKLVYWAAYGKAMSAGDWNVGVPLGVILLAALMAILWRSIQVYQGAQSRWPWAFRLAPYIALAGIALGLLGNAGR